MADPGFVSAFSMGIFFSGLSHTSDLKIDTSGTTMPGACHYRVSTLTGWSDVSILQLDEIESLIYLSVAACTLVLADPSLRYTSIMLGSIMLGH